MTEREFNNKVAEWHESDTNLPIYEFLGMSLQEYGYWVENKMCPDCGHHWDKHVWPGCNHPNPRVTTLGLEVDTCGCTAWDCVG